MAIINDIQVRSGDKNRDEQVKLLYQVLQTYWQLSKSLPAGRFKDDILRYAASKREEYIKGISSNG